MNSYLIINQILNIIVHKSLIIIVRTCYETTNILTYNNIYQLSFKKFLYKNRIGKVKIKKNNELKTIYLSIKTFFNKKK